MKIELDGKDVELEQCLKCFAWKGIGKICACEKSTTDSLNNNPTTTDMPRGIICGDSLEVLKTLADKSVGLLFADPPYGVNLGYDNFDDTEENVRVLVEKFMPEALRVADTVAITPGVRGIDWYPKPTWTLAWINRAGAGRSPWGFSCWQPILVYGKDPFLAKLLGGRGDLIEDSAGGVSGDTLAQSQFLL